MDWLIRTVEVVLLMCGTDILWFSWSTYQRKRLKQVKRALLVAAHYGKKRQLPRMRAARIPKKGMSPTEARARLKAELAIVDAMKDGTWRNG